MRSSRPTTAWIAWDDKLTGFGLRIHPAGTKSFIVNYRAGDGGRKAPNKRVTIGRYGRVTVDQARKLAQNLLGQVAGGADPAYERAMARAMPTLRGCFRRVYGGQSQSFETDQRALPLRGEPLSGRLAHPPPRWHQPPGCRDPLQRHHSRPRLVGGQPRDVAVCARSTAGPASITTVCSNPGDLWLAGGGKFHRKTRRKISTPAEVLPCWRAGIETEVLNPTIRDAVWFGLYTGMRREEVLTLRWERVDMEALTFRVEATKTGVPLELPITRQLAVILQRRLAEAGDYQPGVRDWVFPSPTSATGHVQDPHHLYGRIGKAGGAKFWFHGLRNCFITVAERELMLPPVADQAAGQPRSSQ